MNNVGRNILGRRTRLIKYSKVIKIQNYQCGRSRGRCFWKLLKTGDQFNLTNYAVFTGRFASQIAKYGNKSRRRFPNEMKIVSNKIGGHCTNRIETGVFIFLCKTKWELNVSCVIMVLLLFAYWKFRLCLLRIMNTSFLSLMETRIHAKWTFLSMIGAKKCCKQSWLIHQRDNTGVGVINIWMYCNDAFYWYY